MRTAALKIPTRCAHWGYTEHRFFGHAVFAELAGHESITGLLALSALGRRFTQEQCAIIDDVATCASLADPRIWPLKLTRLVAAYGSTGPAIAAGLLILEGARIGPWPTVKVAETLIELHAKIGGREDDAQFVAREVCAYFEQRQTICGFGTPLRAHDERLVAFRECMHIRKRDSLPYWRTMEAVVVAAQSRRKLEPNISIAVTAAFLDLGVSVEQIGPLTLSTMFHMFLANGVEGAAQSSAVLRELPEDRIRYTGRSARTSPRCDAARRKP
jgi:hypothetical protein